MDEDHAVFHRQVAEQLLARYDHNAHPPAGWREALVWHWHQAGAFAEAADAALLVAEEYLSRFAFRSAHRWAERTLELLERLDPNQRAAYDLRAYALALAVLEFGGQYREGLDYARRMLRVAEDQHWRDAVVRALLAIGRMQRELGQYDEASATLTRASDLAARDELGELEAEARVHLAKVYQLQGRHLEALQELQLAYEEQEQHDDRVKLARVFTALGDVYRVLGARREAITFYQRALSIEQGHGRLYGQAVLKDKLALVWLDENRLDEARVAEEESLRIRHDLGDLVGQARSHTVLGQIVSRMNHHEQAMVYHEQARALEEQTQNQRGQVVALLHLGDEARALRRYDLAYDHYAAALRMVRRSSDQLGLARVLERMGDLHIDQQQRDEANQRWAQALRIREVLGHADEAAALRERIRTGQIPVRHPAIAR